jgi:hypothetical protein
MAGLTAADFEVFDNESHRKFGTQSFKQNARQCNFVFDMSSVIGPLLVIAGSSSHIFNDLKKKTRLCSSLPTTLMGSSPPTDRTRQVAPICSTFPNSSLIDGSYAGLVLAQLSPNPPLLIIFSDGRDTFSWLTGKAVLETAKRNGAVVYAVSTARLPEKSFLRDLAGLTGGSLFEVESIEDLDTMFLGILGEFRQRHLITYIPRGVPETGWHRLDVRVKNRAAKVNARPGYMHGSSDK